MRRLLVAAVVLVLLGAGADFAAARIFEGRVTEALQQEYDLGRRPVVQVRDFPFLPHLATGRFSAIDVAATDLRARGVNAARLSLQLHDVRVPREVLLGEPGGVDVGRAEGQVELTEAEVNRLVASRLPGASLTVSRDGVRVRLRTELLGQPLEAVATGSLGVRARRQSMGRAVGHPVRADRAARWCSADDHRRRKDASAGFARWRWLSQNQGRARHRIAGGGRCGGWR